MLFFNLNKLEKQSNGCSVTMLRMLENYHNKKIPKNRHDVKNFSKVSLYGDSFIEFPERLFSAQVDVNYKVQYIILAAKLDYLFYRTYGIMYLDLSFFPDLNLDKIRHNPLMRIEGNKLMFTL